MERATTIQYVVCLTHFLDFLTTKSSVEFAIFSALDASDDLTLKLPSDPLTSAALNVTQRRCLCDVPCLVCRLQSVVKSKTDKIWDFLVLAFPGNNYVELFLRSTSSLSLIVSLTWLSTVGDRALPVVAARVWNSLPQHITSSSSVAVFQSHLKTHLFSILFPTS